VSPRHQYWSHFSPTQMKDAVMGMGDVDVFFHIKDLSADPCGTRLVQDRLKNATEETRQRWVEALSGAVYDLSTSKSGNYVIQCAVVACDSPPSRIIEELRGRATEACRHPRACRVFCRLAEKSAKWSDALWPLFSEVLLDAGLLSRSWYGAYVAASIAEFGPTPWRDMLLNGLSSLKSRMGGVLLRSAPLVNVTTTFLLHGNLEHKEETLALISECPLYRSGDAYTPGRKFLFQTVHSVIDDVYEARGICFPAPGTEAAATKRETPAKREELPTPEGKKLGTRTASWYSDDMEAELGVVLPQEEEEVAVYDFPRTGDEGGEGWFDAEEESTQCFAPAFSQHLREWYPDGFPMYLVLTSPPAATSPPVDQQVGDNGYPSAAAVSWVATQQMPYPTMAWQALGPRQQDRGTAQYHASPLAQENEQPDLGAAPAPAAPEPVAAAAGEEEEGLITDEDNCFQDYGACQYRRSCGSGNK
jgi:hypothetical protein